MAQLRGKWYTSLNTNNPPTKTRSEADFFTARTAEGAGSRQGPEAGEVHYLGEGGVGVPVGAGHTGLYEISVHGLVS